MASVSSLTVLIIVVDILNWTLMVGVLVMYVYIIYTPCFDPELGGFS